MTDDAELLRRYSTDRSEAAFGELVRRHVDLVYSAAVRRTGGDHHRAQEVTQMVFIHLARKAAALVRHPVLPAWLHRTTALAAADARRREGRRLNYEQAAAAEARATGLPEDDFDWQKVRPLLDGAIDQLAERDREAIVLRFFGNRPFAEVGRQLGLSENAARMRVDRALDKLKERLASRGVKSSSAALALGLSAQVMAAAPAGVATAATAAGVAAGPSAAAIFTFMYLSKLPLSLLAGTLMLGTATLILQQKTIARMQADVATLRSSAVDLDSLKSENRKLTQTVKEGRALQDGASNLDTLLTEEKTLNAQIGALVRQQMAASPKAPLGQIFDPSQLDQVPRPISQTPPSYPFELRQAGLSGRVLVDFDVDSSGAVQNAYAVSSTLKEFEESAIQAVSQWSFTAGQKQGAAVTTHLQVPIVFTLGDRSNINSTLPRSAGPTDWFPTDAK